jgi:hypothetical protein
MCALVVGCGGNDKAVHPSNSGKAATRSERGLSRPLYARCGTDAFAPLPATEITTPDTHGRAWSLQYRRKGVPRPNDTTFVLVVEVGPSSPLRKERTPAVKDVVVSGRDVALRSPRSKSEVFAAQWRTDSAVYSLIANGTSPAVTRKFIACLP